MKVKIVDFSKINLRDEYNRLNNLLFNGQLPEIQLGWSNRKRALGHVRYRVDYDGEVLSKDLSMSKFFSVTYKQFLDTLAHEMIHIYQLTRPEMVKRGKIYHDKHFLREAQRINNMGLGFNITKSNGEDLAISQEAKQKLQGKDLIAMIFDIDGRKSIAVTDPKVYERDHYDIFNLLGNLVNKGRFGRVEADVILSNNIQLQKYPKQRTFERKIGLQQVSEPLLSELEQDNTIRKVILTKNNRDDTTYGSTGVSGLVAENIYYIS